MIAALEFEIVFRNRWSMCVCALKRDSFSGPVYPIIVPHSGSVEMISTMEYVRDFEASAEKVLVCRFKLRKV